MKKGVQITALVAALLWFVLQMYNVIDQTIMCLNLPNPYGLSKDYSFIFNLSIASLPGLFFSATIGVVFIADLAHKILKHEKTLYIISTILFLPTIIQGLINLFNTLVYENKFFKPDLQTFVTLGINLFTLLLWISIFVYLFAVIFNMNKLKRIIRPTFMVIITVNLVITLMQYINPIMKLINLWFLVLITLLVFVLLFLAISGFMLRGIKAVGNPEEVVQPQ